MQKPEKLHKNEFWCFEGKASQFGDLITARDAETAVGKCAEIYYNAGVDVPRYLFVENYLGIINKFKITTEFDPVFHIEGVE